MPNKRKSGNKQVGVWFTAEEIQKVEEAAALYNCNKTDLFKLAIDAVLKAKSKKGKRDEGK